MFPMLDRLVVETILATPAEKLAAYLAEPPQETLSNRETVLNNVTVE